LTTAGLAEALGVSRQTINEVLREKRAISPVMALRLAQLFGNAPEFWLNAQRACDLWQAKRDNQTEIEKIKPLRAAWEFRISELLIRKFTLDDLAQVFPLSWTHYVQFP